VVYIDSVFVCNTLIDYLLLLSTARLTGKRLHRRRYLLAAVLGGTYAAAVFFPGCGVLSLWPVKLAAGVLMAAAAFGAQPHFLRLTALFFLVSCGFAGCVLGLGLLSGGGVPVENGVFYTDIDARVLLIASLAAYLTLSVVFRAAARHGVQGALLPVTVCLNGKSVSLTALRDTGNTLLDPGTGRPLLVAVGAQLTDLWPPEDRALLNAQALRSPVEALERLNRREARFRLLPYSAVGVSGGLLLAFRSDWTMIGGKRYERLLVALSPTELGGGFSALWGGGQREDEQVEIKTSAAASQNRTSAS
jgi:stage II sporulation protein GA (sporulation sigma-E factor processing peptidase)